MNKEADEVRETVPRELEARVGVSASTHSHSVLPKPSPLVLKVTPASQFDPETGVTSHFIEDDDTVPNPTHDPIRSIGANYKEPIVPEIPVILEAVNLQVPPCPIMTIDESPSSFPSHSQVSGEGSGTTPFELIGGSQDPLPVGIHTPLSKASGFLQPTPGEASGNSPPPLVRKTVPSRFPPASGDIEISPSGAKETRAETTLLRDAIPFSETGAQLSPPSTPASTPIVLPEFLKEFGQLRTRLRSSERPSTALGSQEQQQAFRAWVQKDFSASFNLKALHDVEKAIIDLFKAGQLSRAQHDSFLSYFENLRALRDQHQRAERQANRVRCFQEKERNTSARMEHLLDEGSRTEERIGVVTSAIQKLKEQLAVLEAEQSTLFGTLKHQLEEVKKVNQELEHTGSQLISSHTVLAEPDRLFTTMQTYHSRIISLGKDLNLLG